MNSGKVSESSQKTYLFAGFPIYSNSDFEHRTKNRDLVERSRDSEGTCELG